MPKGIKALDYGAIQDWVAHGDTDREIADRIGIHYVTLCNRKKSDPELRAAYEGGLKQLPKSPEQKLDEKILPAAQLKIDDQAMVAAIEDKISRIFHYLDDEKLAKSNATTLSTSLGILIDKRRLLQGQPTAILSFEEKKELDALIPQLIEEAKRRGLAIEDVEYREVK